MDNNQEKIDGGWQTLDLGDVEVELEKEELPIEDEDKEVDLEADELQKEEDEESPEEDKKESSEDDDELGDSEDDSDGEELQKEEKAKPKPKRKSRARDRIQQLANEKNELKKQLEEQQAKLQELQNSSTVSEKNSLEMHKDLLGNQIDALKGNLRNAIEEGDIDKQIDLNAQLADLNVDLRVTDAKLDKTARNIPAAAASSDQDVQQQVPELPQEMVYFIEENPWVAEPKSRDDRKKIMFLREATQDLLKEGYSEQDADFYEELEVMLEEKFGQTDNDDVEYEDENTDSSSKQTLKSKKTKNTSNNKRQKSSVSGASTPPTSKKNKVTLTRDERAFARKMNLTDEQYAKRKRNKQNSEGGWTTIV